MCAELLAPAGTVMDLNIGAALWLAASAHGRVRLYGPTASASKPGAACFEQRSGSINKMSLDARRTEMDSLAGAEGGRFSGEYWSSTMHYTSAARVVLVGHGADEQCAGYSRHRTQFRLRVYSGTWLGSAPLSPAHKGRRPCEAVPIGLWDISLTCVDMDVVPAEMITSAGLTMRVFTWECRIGRVCSRS